MANIGLNRGGPLPDDRDPLRLHRSGVGAHRRDPGRRVRRRVRPALRAAPDLRRWQHHARHLVRRPDRLPGLAAVLGHQRQPAADARGRRPVPVDGRVHRRGRAPGELRHLQQRVQRQDLRRRRAGARHLRVGVHERRDPAPATTGIRVVTDIQRKNPFWQLLDRDQDRVGASTPTTPQDFLRGAADARRRLPDAAVVHQHAPAGTVRLHRPRSRCPTRSRCCRSSSGASRSRGTAARPGRPAGTRCGDTSCKVQVRNQAGGHASLRVSATDAAGRTVTQEVIDAYAVRR